MKYPNLTIVPMFVFAIAACLFGGCSMCCDTYDYDYPVFGGKYQRSDPTWGRLGSIFSDPGDLPQGPDADSNLQDVEMKSPQNDLITDPDDDTNIEPLPEPNRQPEPDDDTARRPWKTRPLRGEWR